MKIVIFGLSISSSWGNGHATLWRGLCGALIGRGHKVVFFERNLPYYAAHRDLVEITGGTLIFYENWSDVLPQARQHLSDAEVGIVTSYCPDALSASDEVLWSRALAVFYDLDTPVTLSRLVTGETVEYIGECGFEDFDLVLSYTGGVALQELKTRLGAKRVAALYGSADPKVHFPVSVDVPGRADLSYLGTYSKDRQSVLEELFIDPARRMPDSRFVIAGAQYPAEFPWTSNIHFLNHLPPSEHRRFLCASRWTLNVTRKPMVKMGYCPSGRLFEAAACGVPILSDDWEGLPEFFEPDEEILVVSSGSDVMAALNLSDKERHGIGRSGRERVMDQHTAMHRAIEFEAAMDMDQETSPCPYIEV